MTKSNREKYTVASTVVGDSDAARLRLTLDLMKQKPTRRSFEILATLAKVQSAKTHENDLA